jgi:hypothetical protein
VKAISCAVPRAEVCWNAACTDCSSSGPIAAGIAISASSASIVANDAAGSFEHSLPARHKFWKASIRLDFSLKFLLIAMVFL